MTPTIVLHEDKPYLVLGSPGGSTIITTVLQVFLNIVLHDMNIQDAVDAPRHHSQWLPDAIMYEPGAIDDSVREELTAMGHAFVERPSIGAANCILIDETGVYGAPDPRRQSTAVGF
jgi:gamma-glutamyltranspeptidase/glutathione hydrolase